MTIPVTLLRYLSCLAMMLLATASVFSQTTSKAESTSKGVRPELRQFAQASAAKFTENRGQIIDTDGKLRPDVLYKGGSNGVDLYFTKRGISYVFSRVEGDADKHLEGTCMHSHAEGESHDHENVEDIKPPTVHLYRTDLELVGANPDVRVTSEDIAQGYYNYYHEHCRDGITGVRSFHKLTYHDVYPNIDMVIHGKDGGVKCDFIVRPGGKVSDIRLRYAAADQTKVLRNGALRVTTPLGYLQDEAPYTFQEGSGVKVNAIRSSYQINDGVVGFSVGKYDPTKPLVIDPDQIWATFYGGTAAERLFGGDPTEVDRNSNVLIIGYTGSTSFVATPGAFQQDKNPFSDDAFFVKFNGRGALQWATYYGGSSSEIGHGISSDKHGNVFITGHTNSTRFFPLVPGMYQDQYSGLLKDAFVAKFTPAGTHLWSTYIGGSGDDDGYGFAVDSNDNVAALVTTTSTTLSTGDSWDPTHNGGFDVLIVKFNPNGTRLWATYFGGSSEEYGYAAASDIDDNIIFTGWTNSSTSTFPATNTTYRGAGTEYDAFVAKFSSAGQRQWALPYGGSSRENKGMFGLTDGTTQGFCGITTDGDKNVLITGTTTSSDFPVTGTYSRGFQGGPGDAFIVKFDPDGARQWATCIGGGGRDVGAGVAANPQGSVLIAGIVNVSAGFPITTPPNGDVPFQATYQGGLHDAFIVKLRADGKQQWGTYFGGGLEDQAHGISFDPFGFIIVGGYTFSTSASPFSKARSPSEPPERSINRGQADLFITVFCDPVPPEIDTSGPTTFCHDQNLTMSVDEGYLIKEWYKAPSLTPFSTQASVTINESGKYYVKVESASGCPAKSDTITVTKLDPLNPIIPPDPNSFCSGDSINVVVLGGPYAKYTWKKDEIVIPTATTATLKVKVGGTYKVIVENTWGCKDSTQLLVTEYPLPTPISVTPTDTIEFCEGENRTLNALGGSGGTIQWSNGAAGSSLNVTQQGLYFAKSVNLATGCSTVSNKVFVRVNPKPIITIVPLLPLEFCEGDSTVLVASRTDYAKYEWSTGEKGQRITVKISGTITLKVTDDKGCSSEARVTVTMHERQFPKITPSGPIVRCEGDTVLLALQGGTFTTILWSSGALGVPAKVTKSGTYFAIVTGPGGCRAYSDTIQVTFTPSPDARISGPKTVCTNSSASYSVPNQPGVSYQWTVTGTGSSIGTGAGTSSIDVNWGPAGTGSVTVLVTHTATSCKATGTLAIDVGSVLVPTIVARPGLTICPGDSAVLDAGPNYATYKWSTGATTRTITVKTAGSYMVTVSNAGGCEGTSLPLVLKVTDLPTPTIVMSRSPVLCPGDTVFLSVSALFSEYSWSGGQTLDRIAVWAAGTYTVTVEDANGCSGTSAPVEVTVAVPPAPVIRGPASVCIASTETYSVTAVSGDSYQWNTTGGQIIGSATGSSITVTWPTAGPGLVEMRQTSGVTGCIGLAQYDVKIGTSLEPEITHDGSTLICLGDSILLSAPDGYASYLWSDGSSGRDMMAKGAGTYSVTVMNSTGCSGTGTVTITEKPPLAPKVVPDGRPGLCVGDSLRLDATPGFTGYLWSTGATTPSIWVKQAGQYTVTVFDADSCSDVSAIVEVTFYPQLSTPLIQAVGDSLVAIVDTVDSPKPMTYQWRVDGQAIAGATLRKHYISIIGSYTVTVIDSNGCSVISAPFTPFVAANAALGLPEIEAAPGERVKIPLTLKSSTNLDRNRVEQFTGELRFDKSLLILADPRFTSTIDGDQQVVKIKGSRPVQMEAGDMLTIDFIAALGDKLTTPLELRNFIWLDGLAGATPITIQQGRFNLVDVCETGGIRLLNTSGNVGIKAVRPNPAGEVAEIEYEVNEDGLTQLFIVDLLGRRVMTLVDGAVPPGSYAVRLDASQLASGMYHCILQTPTLRLHHPLQVEK